MKTNADVIIIGGGVQGTSLLYYLSERGISNVQLIEMNQIGSGTTSRTAGWVMHTQHLEYRTMMTIVGLKEFLSYKDRFGNDVGFVQPAKLRNGAGSLSIGTKDMENELLMQAKRQNSQGAKSEVLSAIEIKEVAPFINVEDVGIGIYCEEDGYILPSAMMDAFVNTAKRRGADVECDTRVNKILISNNKVTGVETSKGRVNSPVIVNAAGPWAEEIGNLIGIKIPLENSVRHELVTGPSTLLNGTYPLIEVLAPEEMYVGYVGSDRNQAMIGIGRWKPNKLEQKADLNRLVDEFGDSLRYRLPSLFDLPIVNHWAGIRPLSPDGLPILGPVEEIDGYINDCCWGGDGVAHSPFGGLIVSGFIAGTNDLPVNIDPFLLSRFSK